MSSIVFYKAVIKKEVKIISGPTAKLHSYTTPIPDEHLDNSFTFIRAHVEIAGGD